MTKPEYLEQQDALRRLKGFPTNEDSAMGVIVRYFADRGVICTRDDARQIVRERLDERTAL